MEQSLWDIFSQYEMFDVWHVLHKYCIWMIYYVMAGKLRVNSQLPPHTKFLNGFRYPTFQA